MNWILQFRLQKSITPSLLIPTPCAMQSSLEWVRLCWEIICWKSWKSFSRTPPTEYRPFWSPWKVSAGEYSGSVYTNILIFAPSLLHKLLLKYQLWSFKHCRIHLRMFRNNFMNGLFLFMLKNHLFSSYFSHVAYSYNYSIM